MKIGIDIQTTLGQKTGFGFYVKNLVSQLEKIDRKNQYVLIKPASETDLSAPKRFYWDQFQVPKRAQDEKVDVLHQPCFSVPIFYRGKVVVTVHDLIARLFGKDIPFYSRQFFGKWMPFSYRRADKIIANSEHTKKDIVKILKIHPKKIKVIYLAAGSEFRKIHDQKKINQVTKKYKTGNKYLLHLGTLNPRKNLEFLIKVFAGIVKDFPQYNLVISGKEGWYFEGLFKLAKKLGLSKKIIFTGYIDDCDKPYLINAATVFTFPSLYEGFGLPLLEAMACGVPVISSNTSSLPEVVGEAGILIKPTDEKAWVNAIKLLLSNTKLRQQYIDRGLKQAQKFSWTKTARETLEVYQEVYNTPPIH
ncbi:MAG: glycosyltransferase family 4 protein [Patescibacteria group bacterium]|nr:glycosyltransferase family 4 protein [Patescibacteria group bacterium]